MKRPQKNNAKTVQYDAFVYEVRVGGGQIKGVFCIEKDAEIHAKEIGGIVVKIGAIPHKRTHKGKDKT